MINKPITYLTISDLHLGKGNLTKQLIYNGKRYLANSKFTKLDIIYIIGDGFDKLLDSNTEVYNESMSFLSYIVRFCSKYKIKLRYIEGTTLHDWNQAKVLYNIIDTLELDIDFKYIDSIHIEHIEEFNLYTLYIPDNMHVDSKDTYSVVKDLMTKLGILKVDNVMIHGAFNFQLPILHKSSHHEDDYLRITNGYIHTGHIHTSKIYKRIIGCGSLDRLSHGEEEKKGGYLITWIPNKIPTYTFIENKYAIIFKTFKISELDITKIYESLDKKIKRHKEGSHIRIQLTKKNSLIKDIEKDIKRRYKEYVLKIDKEIEKPKDMYDDIDTIDVLDINPSNIVEIIMENINDTEDKDIMLEELRLVI